jgi:hypothetical protein
VCVVRSRQPRGNPGVMILQRIPHPNIPLLSKEPHSPPHGSTSKVVSSLVSPCISFLFRSQLSFRGLYALVQNIGLSEQRICKPSLIRLCHLQRSSIVVGRGRFYAMSVLFTELGEAECPAASLSKLSPTPFPPFDLPLRTANPI